jgi:hypothetical protein
MLSFSISAYSVQQELKNGSIDAALMQSSALASLPAAFGLRQLILSLLLLIYVAAFYSLSSDGVKL